MKITDLICAPGRSGFFNKDLAAIKAGARPDGFRFIGAPVTPGYRQVIQPGEAISVMLILEDGQVAAGDCVDVFFAGASGRDPLFQVAEHLPYLTGEMREFLTGKELRAFRPLAEEIEAYRRNDAPLHTAVRYGLTQALLHACALAGGKTMAEVIAAEWDCEIAKRPIPILAMVPGNQLALVDKMILKEVEILPHASFPTAKDLGPEGAHAIEYFRALARRIGEIGAPDYHPTLHTDLYGSGGEMCGMELERVADFIGRLEEAARPYPLYVETPLVADALEVLLDLHIRLMETLSAKGIGAKIIADEWVNTLEEIKTFADAGAAHFIHVKPPDLGGLHLTADALLHCQSKDIGTYAGGAGNETDLSTRATTHVALACRADFMMCKPGIGGDEGLMIETNEMKRALALAERSRERLK